MLWALNGSFLAVRSHSGQGAKCWLKRRPTVWESRFVPCGVGAWLLRVQSRPNSICKLAVCHRSFTLMWITNRGQVTFFARSSAWCSRAGWMGRVRAYSTSSWSLASPLAPARPRPARTPKSPRLSLTASKRYRSHAARSGSPIPTRRMTNTIFSSA